MDESQIKNLLNSSKYLVGKRQTLRALLETADVNGVIIAEDSEKHIISSVVDLCKMKSVHYEIVNISKSVLGSLAGIKVDCSMICLLKN